jgi:hypothetical protein
MTETEPDPALPPQPLPVASIPRPAVISAPPPAVVAAKPRRNFWPVLGVIGFLLLAAGEGY